MLGNFTFHNPTKLHFGEDSLSKLSEELKNYGRKVMLCYGGGSIKRNGIYDQVMAELKKAGCEVVEIAGVMPNPTIEKVLEGAHTARQENVDFILGVGGGSTVDYCKAVAGSAWYDGDPWEYYFKNWQPMTCRWIPVGCVLTMAGTGSEMDSCSVISSHTENRKMFYNFRNPDFAILNPRFTFTVPKYQMVAGIYDIMSHILEQYLSGTDDNTSDYIAEGLMRSLIVSSRKANVNPEDYEARSNIMWTATWALNTLIGLGKKEDWMVHMIGHSVGAWTHAPHGYALASVSMAYYRRAMENGLPKFARFAHNVWDIPTEGKTERELAEAGLQALKNWMLEIGLPLTISELGATADMIPGITETTVVYPAGYLDLTKQDITDILKESM